MNRHRLRAVAAAVLAMLCAALLTSCAFVDAIVNGLPEDATPTPAPARDAPAQITVTPAPVEEETAQPVVMSGSLQLVPFPQMVYTQPNVDAVVAELDSLADIMAGAQDVDTATHLLDRAEAIFDSYDTALTLARIHNSIDTSDPYWQAEYAHCSNGLPAVQKASSGVLAALRESPAGEALGAEPYDSVFSSSEIVDLMATESTLVSQYYSLRGTLSASHEGAEYTFAQATESGPYVAWVAQNAPALGDIYVNLLKVRRQIANVAGYDNYIEYAAAVDGFDYGAASQLLDDISAHIVPVYRAAMDKGTYKMEDKFSDEVVLQNLTDWIGGTDPSMLSAVDLMRAYLLYDFAPGAHKEATAYTTYITDYGAPFLFATVDGSFEAMMDVLHEFGHFYAYTKDPSYDTLPIDTMEVPSTTLPLLLSGQFSTTYGAQESGAMLHNELVDALATFPEQGYYAGFEMAAYQLPVEDITFENLCAIAQQQWDRFGLGESVLSASDWTTTMHIYESPFYTFSYIPATDVALQIWELSTQDRTQAVRTYQDFLSMAPASETLVGTAEYCGLASPYAAGEMQSQADWLTRYLLQDEAMPPQEQPAETTIPDATPATEALEQTQEGTLVPSSAPQPTQEPAPTAQQPGGEPGAIVISPPDEDRYGEHFGVTDGTTTVWSASRAGMGDIEEPKPPG